MKNPHRRIPAAQTAGIRRWGFCHKVEFVWEIKGHFGVIIVAET